MQIPILNGIYTDAQSEWRTSYPRNLTPIVQASGLSAGFLRPADGIVEQTALGGIDRGGINWRDVCYRVAGEELVRVNADDSVTTIGNVGGSGQVSMDYSFEHLAIASGGKLYLYDTGTLQQVTDADLGTVLDVLWVDGYFMTTDGTYLVVTELNNPFAVNPLKYGSAEVDPDPIQALLKVRNEVHAVGRYTVESFANVGGDLFPFQRIEGAQIQRGAVGTHACCLYREAVAFLGSGRNESCGVWLGSSGQSIKLSTREIDRRIRAYNSDELSDVLLEARVDCSQELLYVHLPNETLVYDGNASTQLQQPVWYRLTSSIVGAAQYRARNLVWCYCRWIVGDTQQARLGYLSDGLSSHWGEPVGWDFDTAITYNDGNGAIFHRLELIATTGRAALGDDPTIWASYSLDGETYSQERAIKAGTQGDRLKRLVWLRCGAMRKWRIQRFRGTSDAHVSIARLEAQLEPLVA